LLPGVAQYDMNGSSERWHGVQALACRLGPLENGSHKLKLELHALFQSFRASQRDMNGSSERWHGVQALACRFGPLENGSHKLKLELHALFQSFRASQRDMKAPLKMVWSSAIRRSVGIIELDRLMAELQTFSLRHQ